jgi:hypothetical protein
MEENLDLAVELLGIDQSIIAAYDVLCLPENYGTHDQQVDASEALDFYKTLKSQGISCANSYDLGLDSKIITRHGDDIWLGQIYIINDFIIPTLMTVLEHYITSNFSSARKQVTLTDEPKVHLELKMNKKGKISKIKFDGTSEDVLKIIKAFK